MTQVQPGFGRVHPDPASLAASIGFALPDIGFQVDGLRNQPTEPLQPQVMSTFTTRHLLVPLSSIEALNRVSVQRDRLLEQLAAVDEMAYGLYLFTPVPASREDKPTNEAPVPMYQARFFSPGMSTEDPATGSAAGPLSAYLWRRGLVRLVGGKGRIRVQQGLRLGRECVIEVELSVSGSPGCELLDVDLIGTGVQIATGQISVPDSSTVF
jgi:PhzF family phenazine biosynthesis protein